VAPTATGALDASTCFREFGGHVYRWARALCSSHEDALDVVQDVFLRWVRSPPRVARAGDAAAWLRRVAVRVAIDRWRSLARRTPRQAGAPAAGRPGAMGDAAESADRAHGPLDEVERREQHERIVTALTLLSEQQRLVLLSKCYEGLTFAQIAADLELSVPTVKTHYLRALTRVRDELRSRRHARAAAPRADAHRPLSRK
jgi:RNA polymerase sigma-70 factor (ECF subfamily)